MGKVYLFRGRAATGKTMITNQLSTMLNVPILRKDDIFDPLASYDIDRLKINSASYDILGRILQTNIDRDCDIIVDIALPHTPSLQHFLSKLDLKKAQIFHFLCICSNKEEWRRRIAQRMINPAPNQYFTSVEEAEAHYEKMDTQPLENEVSIDSAEDSLVLMDRIYHTIGYKNIELKL